MTFVKEVIHQVKHIKDLLSVDGRENLTVIERFTNENGTKAETYRLLNPDLKVHNIYKTREYIYERERIQFTRLRLCSHNLNIERGRWTRTVREDRLCDCGLAVQDEEHVLLDCSITDDIRRQFNINREEYVNIGLLMDTVEPKDLVRFIQCCMRKFE